MILLPNSLQAWNTPDFAAVLKQELSQSGAGSLPLQQGLSSGSYALDAGLSVMLISAIEAGGLINVKVGVFYKGVIAGCNCADDPTPVEAQNEYCEVELVIDKVTAQTTVRAAG